MGFTIQLQYFYYNILRSVNRAGSSTGHLNYQSISKSPGLVFLGSLRPAASHFCTQCLSESTETVQCARSLVEVNQAILAWS